MSLLQFNAWNGFFDKDSGSLGWASLSNGAVSVGGDLGSLVAANTSQGIGGAGRPAPNAGVDVGYIGSIAITGLVADTVYTWTLTQGVNVVSGSVRTMPADAAGDFTVFMSTCDNQTHHLIADPFTTIKDKALSSTNPLAYAHIDDVGYFDNQQVADPDTSVVQTSPYLAGTEYAYALAWLAYFGLLDTLGAGISAPRLYNVSTDTDRLWVMRNLQWWVQWGDHEIAPDYGRAVEDPSSSSSGRDPALLAVAKGVWETCMEAAIPPYLGDNSLVPPSTGSGQAWGFDVGSVRIASYDCNTFSQPFNAQDSGEATDSRFYGRIGTPSHGGVVNGLVTNPTKAEINTEFGTVGLNPTQYLGDSQIETLLSHLSSSNSPFKWVFASNGISSKNEPWAERWPDEFDAFCNRDDAGATRTAGIFKHPQLNGQGGKLTFIKGDSHSREVNRYVGDSTPDGDGRPLALGGADNKELWEFNPGTINGSWNGGSLGTIFQGGERVYGEAGQETWRNGVNTPTGNTEGNGSTVFASFLQIDVVGSAQTKFQKINMVDSSDGAVLYTAYQYETQISNNWTEVEGAPMAYFGLKLEAESGFEVPIVQDRTLGTTSTISLLGTNGLEMPLLTEDITLSQVSVFGEANSGATTRSGVVEIWDATVAIGGRYQPANGAGAGIRPIPLFTSDQINFVSTTTKAVESVPISGVIPAGVRPYATWRTTSALSPVLGKLDPASMVGGASALLDGITDDTWSNAGNEPIGIWVDYVAITTAPTLTTPYSIGTNNGPLFSATSSDTIATVEGAGFLDDNPGWASLLKTGDVIIIECSNGTKMYNLTVDKQAREITLSTGLVIA